MNPRGPTFEVFTLFPEAVEAFAAAGLLGKGRARGVIGLHCTNFRDFATDKHRTVDDTPFGGGPGMVLRPEPVVAALSAVERARGPMHRVLLDPGGRRFDQAMARRFATYRRIGLLCGRYEGFDARIGSDYVDETVSIGDFVLNGGEVAALAIIEAVFRLCEGAVGNPASVASESHERDEAGALLEAPQFTRPAVFDGKAVPGVLRGGDHAKVERWRAKKARERTWLARPDLRDPPAWTDRGVDLFVAAPAAAAHALLAPAAAALREAAVTGVFAFGAGGGEVAVDLARALGGRPAVSSFRDAAGLRRRLRRRLDGPVGFLWLDPRGPVWAPERAPEGPPPTPAVVGGYVRDVVEGLGARGARAVVVVLDPDPAPWRDAAPVVPVEPSDPLGLAVCAEIAQAPSPQDPARRLRHVLEAVRAAWHT